MMSVRTSWEFEELGTRIETSIAAPTETPKVDRHQVPRVDRLTMTSEEYIDLLRHTDPATIAEARKLITEARRLLGVPDGRHHLELTQEEVEADKKRWAEEIVKQMKDEGKFP